MATLQSLGVAWRPNQIHLLCMLVHALSGYILVEYMYTDVYKPSLSYVGRFGGVLLTYIASAMLHVRCKCSLQSSCSNRVS